LAILGFRNWNAGGKYFVPDKEVRNHTEEALFNMALAYWYTGADKYAERFSDIMFSFFLNPATSVNPNLNNAQVLSQTYIVSSPICDPQSPL
jgi:hypothetical protein